MPNQPRINVLTFKYAAINRSQKWFCVAIGAAGVEEETRITKTREARQWTNIHWRKFSAKSPLSWTLFKTVAANEHSLRASQILPKNDGLNRR
jgi:hypothetical protein